MKYIIIYAANVHVLDGSRGGFTVVSRKGAQTDVQEITLSAEPSRANALSLYYRELFYIQHNFIHVVAFL